MSARSRRKGAAWEREVAGDLEAATGVRCVRCLTETRDGNVGDITTTLPFSIQAKVGARPPIYEAVEQAQQSARGGQFPVAAIKRNGSGGRPPERLAVLPWDDFLALLTAYLTDQVVTNG
jgi:hypothetical protein